MFTGIVEGTGTVQAATRRGDVMAVRIDVGGLFEGLALRRSALGSQEVEKRRGC